MFSNRVYLLKVGVALALLFAGFEYAWRTNRDVNPPLWRARLQAKQFDGARLWISEAMVEDVRDGEFTIRVGKEPARVVGTGPTQGQRIALIVTYHADRCELLRWEPLPFHGFRMRPILDVVSAAVLLVVGFLFLRRYRLPSLSFEPRR